MRRFGLFERCEQMPDGAQIRQRVLTLLRPHGERDARRRAEQIAQHGRAIPLRLLEQYRRPAGLQHTIADLRHFEFRIDFESDPFQLAARLQLGEKFAQVRITHGRSAPASKVLRDA